MNIIKCDICKKVINRKEEEKFSVSFDSPEVYYSNHDICKNCGKPIKNFLMSKRLISEIKK